MRLTFALSNNRLDRAMIHGQTEKDVQKAIRSVAMKTRTRLVRDAKSNMPSDPRNAAQAVSSSTYSRVLGFNERITSPRTLRNTGSGAWAPPPRRLRKGQRGGNRMKRSQRTNQMDSYTGRARWFTLMWMNNGADRTNPGSQRQRGNRIPANRGKIAGKHWFQRAGKAEMQWAIDELSKEIEKVIEKALK